MEAACAAQAQSVITTRLDDPKAVYSEDVTYSGADGALTDLKPFVQRGGESVAVDENVPERPIDIAFGGQDRRTLFILTHHALYSARDIARST